MGYENCGGYNKGKGKAYAWLVEHASYQGDECLPWPFSIDPRTGRGTLGHEGRSYKAHRLMCRLAHGEPPSPKHQAAHNCGKGNAGCCNPRHLEWKTGSENQKDRRRHGDTAYNYGGVAGHISEEQKAQIAALKGTMPMAQIADRLGLKVGTVQYWVKDRADRGHGKRELYAWRSHEDEIILAGVAKGLTIAKIAPTIPGRGIGSVYARAIRLGIRSRESARQPTRTSQ